MPKTCFVIGPIGAPGSPTRTAADDFFDYIVTRCPALKEFGYDKPVRADMLPEPGRITSQIIRYLMEAQLVIADLTSNNANVYYELSLRHALGKPVIHMADEGTDLSFDVSDNRAIFYTMHSRSVERARKDLADQIAHIEKPGYQAANTIVETVGIVELAKSGDAASATILQAIESLRSEVGAVRTQVRRLESQGVMPVYAVTPGSGDAGYGGIAGLGGIVMRPELARFSMAGTPVALHAASASAGAQAVPEKETKKSKD